MATDQSRTCGDRPFMLERVVLVGRFPPPYGGVSVHVERLANRLAAHGTEVEVWDLYRPLLGVRPRGLSEGVSREPRVLGIHEVVLSRMRTRSPVVHVHVSSGRWLLLLMPFIKLFIRSVKKSVLTVHGGAWVSRFNNLGKTHRLALIRALRNFDDVICVSYGQRQQLQHFLRARVHVIPAYLTPAITAGDPVIAPAHVQRLKEQVDAVLLTSGYGDPNYEYEIVLRAAEMAARIDGIRLGLVIATYGRWVQPYWGKVVKMAEASDIPVVLTYDLSPAEFIGVLRLARVYIRATRMDGDAVSIREAAWAGAQVLASDCCSRPDGTVVFPTGNVAALQASIASALRDPDLGRPSEAVFADFFERIRSVYDA